MSINTENTLKYDKVALKQQPLVDRLSFFFGKILTSTLLIIIVMITFLIGVAVHLADVFDSWFLAIGMQAVILIASTNSDILPTLKIGKDKTLTLIPLVMSFLMMWYLFISFKGLSFDSGTVEFWTAMSKAVGLASTEFMFSYLFTFRFNKFMKDLNSLKSDNTDVVNEYKRSNTIANELVPVQPMSPPTGEVMAGMMDNKEIVLNAPVYDGTSPKITEFDEPKSELFPEVKAVPKPVKVKAREGAGRIL